MRKENESDNNWTVKELILMIFDDYVLHNDSVIILTVISILEPLYFKIILYAHNYAKTILTDTVNV